MNDKLRIYHPPLPIRLIRLIRPIKPILQTFKKLTTMTKFDINRFGKVLLWSAQMTKKEMLTNMGAMFFTMFIPFLMHLLQSYHADIGSVTHNLMSFFMFEVIIYFIITVIGGCWLFSNMKTKEQRITFKMLPATDLEKFVARALYVTVVWWVMAFIAFCAADVFRMLASLIAGIPVVKCLIPDFASILLGMSEYNSFNVDGMAMAEACSILALAYAWLFWLYSFYILGGALFRRRQFVFTTLAHFIIGMAFLPLFVGFVDDINQHIAREMFAPLAWTGAAVFALWGVADWVLSYKIFRRMQVINNKWVNL